MNIELTIDDRTVSGELFENPVARQLGDLLPLTLTFDDYNDVEKVAQLKRELILDGVPDVDEPHPGEIGYYAPLQTLVLYYGSPGRWPGLVRVGRFDHDLDALRALENGTVISIAKAAKTAETVKTTGWTGGQNAFGDFAPGLVHYTDKVLFDEVWERDGLAKRDRSLVTVAALTAMGKTDQLRFHLAFARQNGVTDDELKEALLQLAFYTGWPNGMAAMTVLKEIIDAG